MKANSFEQEARLIRLEGFKKKLTTLRDDHRKIQEMFDKLCDDLDAKPLNENYVNEITSKLTFYLAEMEGIEMHIKSITKIIKNLTMELSN